MYVFGNERVNPHSTRPSKIVNPTDLITTYLHGYGNERVNPVPSLVSPIDLHVLHIYMAMVMRG